MANTANISKDAFQQSKSYFGRIVQQGVPLFDWDINEHSEELRYWILHSLKSAIGTPARLYSGSGSKSFKATEASPNTNDLKFASGQAVLSGRYISISSDFDYNDDTKNYITVGQVTSTAANGGNYDFSDTEKVNYSNGYQLWAAAGNANAYPCRVKFLSGTHSGSTFTIQGVSGSVITLPSGANSIAVGDHYKILPPAIVTPSAGTTDEFWLLTWFEDISPKEDNIIENLGTASATYTNLTNKLHDSTTSISPSHRKQLRWCVHYKYNDDYLITDPLGEAVETHIAIKICTVARTANTNTLLEANITDEANYYMTASNLYSSLVSGTNTDTLTVKNLTVNTAFISSGTSTLSGNVTITGTTLTSSAATTNTGATSFNDADVTFKSTVSGATHLTWDVSAYSLNFASASTKCNFATGTELNLNTGSLFKANDAGSNIRVEVSPTPYIRVKSASQIIADISDTAIKFNNTSGKDGVIIDADSIDLYDAAATPIKRTVIADDSLKQYDSTGTKEIIAIAPTASAGDIIIRETGANNYIRVDIQGNSSNNGYIRTANSSNQSTAALGGITYGLRVWDGSTGIYKFNVDYDGEVKAKIGSTNVERNLSYGVAFCYGVVYRNSIAVNYSNNSQSGTSSFWSTSSGTGANIYGGTLENEHATEWKAGGAQELPTTVRKVTSAGDNVHPIIIKLTNYTSFTNQSVQVSIARFDSGIITCYMPYGYIQSFNDVSGNEFTYLCIHTLDYNDETANRVKVVPDLTSNNEYAINFSVFGVPA
tara:strand:+ start:12467 stop:14779 length:2313 start_codon:yes stop_codon:yes gene_type:complete